MAQLIVFLKWLVEKPARMIGAGAALLVLMFGGVALMAHPWTQKARDISQLTEQIDAARVQYRDTLDKLDSEGQWFTTGYTETVSAQLDAVGPVLDQAEQKLEEAKGYANPDTARATVEEGFAALKHAEDLLASSTQYLTQLFDARNSARTQVGDLDLKITDLKKRRNEALKILREENKYSPVERTNSAYQTLVSVESGSDTLEDEIRRVISDYLPDDDSIEQRGDPRAAISATTVMSATLIQLDGTLEGAEQALAYLQTARTELPDVLNNAQKQAIAVRRQVTAESAKRGYVDGILAQSLASLQTADERLQVATEMVNEPRIDYVAAYEVGQQSLGASFAAQKNFDELIKADDESRELISSLSSSLQGLSSKKETMMEDLATLAANHAADTWSAVQQNGTTFDPLRNVAQAYLRDAQVAQSQQNFIASRDAATAGLQYVAKAQILVTDVEALLDSLETARRGWQTKLDSMDTELAVAYAAVTKYRSYTTLGESWLLEAQSLAAQAKGYSSDLHYSAALQTADDAISKAQAAAIKAKSDYDDEQARLEAKRKRDKAAADAAREQLYNQTNNNWGSNYGGSNYGGGNYGGGSSLGGSSDGGSFSGGYSSDNNSFPY
ncbi:MAG: hypothetical protein UZ21_OP11001000691 [Microgenomates bacterium OLB22]|nr:MAG: hypothetical protein UZ21_OP11001000691 [Microgenomates bacterium OLB22]